MRDDVFEYDGLAILMHDVCEGHLNLVWLIRMSWFIYDEHVDFELVGF